jgi:alcohol dehydrogenase, propanol-preferring
VVFAHSVRGETSSSVSPQWPGLSQRNGGYSEYMLVPSYRLLVKVPKRGRLNPEEIAPLTTRVSLLTGQSKR